MSDEYLDVVFVYEQERPERLQEIRDRLPDGEPPGRGDMTGWLSRYFVDDPPPGTPDLPLVKWAVQETQFEQDVVIFDQSYEERFEVFLDTIEDIYRSSEDRPAFVYAVQHHFEEAIVEIGTPPVDADAIADDRINYAVWLNVFPPPLVETYRRERLLSAPAWLVDEWEDGSILLVAYEDPCRSRLSAISTSTSVSRTRASEPVVLGPSRATAGRVSSRRTEPSSRIPPSLPPRSRNPLYYRAPPSVCLPPENTAETVST